MMASFLQVIVSKKEQTNREKYVFYCSVSQIHINPKKHEKYTCDIAYILILSIDNGCLLTRSLLCLKHQLC